MDPASKITAPTASPHHDLDVEEPVEKTDLSLKLEMSVFFKARVYFA